MKKRLGTMILVLALVLAALPASQAAPAAPSYTVNSTDDENDGTCNSTHCSLREAILGTNEAKGGGIVFDIPKVDLGYSGGVWTIQPDTPLPLLSGGDTTINGYSQPGAHEASAEDVPATIKIEIDGTNVTDPNNRNGFNIISSGNTIKGLAINRFAWSGIAIFPYGGSSATNNTVAGNFIGTDTSGYDDYGNGRDGVSILLGAQNNTVGGALLADWNVISGNGWDGVGIHGEDTMGNVVTRSYIGADVGGWADLGNSRHGVHIYGGAHHNTIGGDIGGGEIEWNIISGNDWDGVHIAGGDTRNNVVSSNKIGVALTGVHDVGNSRHGVHIDNGAHHNVIGGDAYLERNIIACNGLDGVHIADGAHDNTIGSGDGSYDRSNIISGNADAGVVISGTNTMSNTVSGNYIGVSSSGGDTWGNQAGVKITGGAQNNAIGGDTETERNVISGNQESGVVISGDSTSGNVVLGNYIGTAADGTSDMGNVLHGVHIDGGAHDNTVGPDNTIAHNGGRGVDINGTYTTPAMSNTVSGNSIYHNTSAGIMLTDAEYNTVSGNTIGLTGGGDVGANNGDGVTLFEARHNTIGPDNVISGNTSAGINIMDAQDNTIFGNAIGTDASGALAAGFGNGQAGIRLDDDCTGNTIGGTAAGAGNVIAGNGGHGIYIMEEDATGGSITRNSIYANAGDGIKVPSPWTPAAPVIVATLVGSVQIVGTACPDCTVEVFANSDDDGEGEMFVGDDTADGSGTFVVTVASLPPGAPYLTATATDDTNTTSEFSDVFESTISAVFLPLVLR